MPTSRAHLIAATRQALVTASAVLGIAAVAAGQTTYKLTIPTLFTAGVGYLGTAQVTSTPAGIDCRSESSGLVLGVGTCSAEFPAGSPVTLTASPLYGGTVDGWVGACAGQGATCHLTMTGALTTSPKTIAKTYTLTVRATGNAHGFIGNVDDFARPPLGCAIGPGGSAVGTCTTEYPANQIAWLRREESALGYARFAGYTGCGNDTGNCRMVMDGPKTVTAGWVAMQVIIGAGPGSGTGKVTGVATNNPIGSFDCTITQRVATGACSAIWETTTPPMSVSLTATPTGNSVFLGWSGQCSVITGPTCVVQFQIDSLKVFALFDTPSYALSVAASGSGSGKVTSTPDRIACVITAGTTGSNCTSLFPSGTPVTLTADPTGGSTFGGWSGACSGTQPTCTVTVAAATNVAAQFVAPRPASELAAALLGTVTISDAERRELDRFGNKDGTFNLGDLLALLSRTGERLSATRMSALLHAQRGDGRTP